MNTTTNLTAGRNKAVHSNVAQCGGKSLRGLTTTSAPVTCKRCLKALAAEASQAYNEADGIKGQLRGLLRF